MTSFYNKLNNLVKRRPPEENVAGSLSRLILSRERASNCIEALEARLQSAEYVIETARKLLNAEGELTVNGTLIPEDLWLDLNLDITTYDEGFNK